LVSGYAHVFVLLYAVIVVLPLATVMCRSTSSGAEAAVSVAVSAGDAVKPQVQPVLHRVARSATRSFSLCRISEDRPTLGATAQKGQHDLRILQSCHEVNVVLGSGLRQLGTGTETWGQGWIVPVKKLCGGDGCAIIRP